MRIRDALNKLTGKNDSRISEGVLSLGEKLEVESVTIGSTTLDGSEVAKLKDIANNASSAVGR